MTLNNCADTLLKFDWSSSFIFCNPLVRLTALLFLPVSFCFVILKKKKVVLRYEQKVVHAREVTSILHINMLKYWKLTMHHLLFTHSYTHTLPVFLRHSYLLLSTHCHQSVKKASI